MKRKFFVFALLFAFLLVLPACDMATGGSLKTLTKPYIATYECVEARLGQQDLLEKYEYINITLLNAKEFEISFKPNGGDKKSFKGEYTVNPETREFQGEIGVMGINFKEKTKIENGEFTLTRNFIHVTLFMKFKMK
ncbi:MAG: hypothetical protein HFE41_04260 [Clostridia bacterium]|jgi:hypothetical protein|nr:hypothetical protein [Clostridia bacterium]